MIFMGSSRFFPPPKVISGVFLACSQPLPAGTRNEEDKTLHPTMNKLTCFAFVLSLLWQANAASAQTCSAAFNWNAGANKTVSFYTIDSIGLTNRWVFGDGSQQTTTSFSITHTYAQP